MLARELAFLVGAKILSGDADCEITGVANLEDAQPGQLAPLTDAQYAPQAKTTKAGAILTSEKFKDGLAGTSALILLCDDPEVAFIEAIRAFNPPIPEESKIHPTAVIDSKAKVAERVHIGPFVVIRAGATIGDGTVLMAHVVVGRKVTIGAECVIHPNVVIYDRASIGNRVVLHSGVVIGADGFGYKFRNGRHVKVPHVGTVELGDDVEVGANSCIDRGALGPTRIGAGTKIDNLVQIAHNVRVGRHCIICGQAALAGSSGMDDYSVLAGQAALCDHAFLGKGAKVGAKSGVHGQVPPGAEMFGFIADDAKSTKRQYIAMRRLPDLIERIRKLEQTVLQSPNGKSDQP